jgi:hypothetical protein
MIGRNSFLKSAMGALLMLGLASCMAAQQATPPANAPGAQQQTPSTRGAGTAAGEEVDHGPQPDPNMPYPSSWPGLDVEWTYSSSDRATPQNLRFRGSHATHATGPVYLGWTTEEGSWFANTDEKGRVYIWKNNALTQTAYRNENEIPEGVVLRLRNLQEPYMLTRFGKSAPSTPAAPAQQAAKAPQRGDGLFGDPKAVGNALAGLQNQTPAPASGALTGTGATVQGGVLTFTSAGNTKASYKVVRPAVMRNAPQASGTTGAWAAMEENGMGILFTVQPDGSVTGREMPAQIIQALTQATAR